MIRGDSFSIQGTNCSSINDPKFTITVDPQKAKRLKDDLAVLVIVKLVDPYILKSTSNYSEPTYPYNHGWSTSSHYLGASIEQIWLYDTETGEVLAKRINNKTEGDQQNAN